VMAAAADVYLGVAFGEPSEATPCTTGLRRGEPRRR
jgi:hypothetical protein